MKSWSLDYGKIAACAGVFVWLVYAAWGDLSAMLAVAAGTGCFFYVADRM